MSGPRVLFLTLVFVFSCQSADYNKIVVPQLNAGFYTNALTEIDKKLRTDADGEKLHSQKLYYCERLDWPTSCLSALEREKDLSGMTVQLAENFVRYYVNHADYTELKTFIDRWNSEFDLYQKNQRWYIKGLIMDAEYERAQVHLRGYLSTVQDTATLAFAAEQYLFLGDTVLANFYLSNLYSESTDHPLVYQYASFLFRANKHVKGQEVIKSYAKNNELSLTQAFQASTSLRKHGYLKDAISLLKPHHFVDSAAFFLSDIYISAAQFDSSILVLDSVIARNPANLKARWKKARAFEDKGWYSYATSLLEDILELDSSNLEAKERVTLIQRKIAYLQRQKREVIVPPKIELKPIKIDN